MLNTTNWKITTIYHVLWRYTTCCDVIPRGVTTYHVVRNASHNQKSPTITPFQWSLNIEHFDYRGWFKKDDKLWRTPPQLWEDYVIQSFWSKRAVKCDSQATLTAYLTQASCLAALEIICFSPLYGCINRHFVLNTGYRSQLASREWW